MNVIISCGVTGALVHPFPTRRGLGHVAQVRVLTRVPGQGQEQGQEPGLEPGLQGRALPDPGHHGNDPEPERGQDRVPGPSLLAGLGLVHFHDHLLPGHIPHVVVEIILQDAGYLHVTDLHPDLHQDISVHTKKCAQSLSLPHIMNPPNSSILVEGAVGGVVVVSDRGRTTVLVVEEGKIIMKRTTLAAGMLCHFKEAVTCTIVLWSHCFHIHLGCRPRVSVAMTILM